MTDAALPLAGVLVVALEQAVAAPFASSRLADAGARVLKLERPEGDFARGYDAVAKGQSSYFVWLNRGKESVTIDLARAEDRALFAALVARADVFIQNLKPGALAKLGFAVETLRAQHPRLITCSISGYGDSGPMAARKAYDLLIQAEAGLASITGGPEGASRTGISIVDIATGATAVQAILEALLARHKTGAGADIRVSMFDTIADWMAVPFLQAAGGAPPGRAGLAHPSISPYGAFMTRDGKPLLISVQNEREWVALCDSVFEDPEFARDPRFDSNVRRVENRRLTDARAAAHFARFDKPDMAARLARADIAFASVSDIGDLLAHPHLRVVEVETPNGAVAFPAPGARVAGSPRIYGAVPAKGADTQRVRAEFLGA